MTTYLRCSRSNEEMLYNKILLISRNKLFYTKLRLNDTFENRINLIFFHISFLFIKSKEKGKSLFYKEFCQRIFDFIFKKIELNMREINYGDMAINKNMKLLVKTFYSILLFCENYKNKNIESRKLFLYKYLSPNTNKKDIDMHKLAGYFDRYQAFCFDLSKDSVLKGKLNFNVERTLNI